MVNPNYVFLLSLTIILIGYIIKRLKIITEQNGKIIARIILNVTLPALIFLVINNIDIRISLVILPFICLGYSAILAFIAFLTGFNIISTKYEISFLNLSDKSIFRHRNFGL
jgi:hypothetical protein